MGLYILTGDIESSVEHHASDAPSPGGFSFWFYVCRIARLKGWSAALEMIGDRPIPKAIMDWKEQNNIV